MIILACATELERRHALARTGSRPAEALRFSFAGRDVLACVVGVGPVAAALTMGELLARHPEADGVLNLGICGSFDPRLPLGTICAASAEIWPEYGVNRTNGTEEAFSFQMLPDVNLTPVNRMDFDPAASARAMGFALPETWPQGPSLTVAGVSGDPERASMLLARHDAATENMEGFSLALAARRRNLPFLEVRTVSNTVGDRDTTRWNFRAALESLQAVLPALCGVPA
jgi:futalosine hydrolase